VILLSLYFPINVSLHTLISSRYIGPFIFISVRLSLYFPLSVYSTVCPIIFLSMCLSLIFLSVSQYLYHFIILLESGLYFHFPPSNPVLSSPCICAFPYSVSVPFLTLYLCLSSQCVCIFILFYMYFSLEENWVWFLPNLKCFFPLSVYIPFFLLVCVYLYFPLGVSVELSFLLLPFFPLVGELSLILRTVIPYKVPGFQWNIGRNPRTLNMFISPPRKYFYTTARKIWYPHDWYLYYSKGKYLEEKKDICSATAEKIAMSGSTRPNLRGYY
jgi:hypothetical protein